MAALPTVTTADAYVHEAYFYDGIDDFVDSSADFILQGIRDGDHVVVAVVPEKIDLLRAALGDDAALVTFIDMAEAGRNPARVIQVWRDLVEAAALRGSRVRGIGEPIWSGRSEEEILEAHLHEALLNVGIDADSHLLLRCPYDVSSLEARVVDVARMTHPEIADVSQRAVSGEFAPHDLVSAAFEEPLEPPRNVEVEVDYDGHDLGALRDIMAGIAAGYGMGAEATESLTLAVREIAVNSVRYGGGAGRLRAWVEGETLICELSDAGYIEESMIGRIRPRPDKESGRGVWLANQLCDLVQIRTSRGGGTVVRLHMGLRPGTDSGR